MSEKMPSANTIISIVVAFILIAVLIPIGLDSIFAMVLPQGAPAVLTTLLQTLLPIMAILAIVMYFVPKSRK